jgi:hypothetical protein
MSEPEVLESVRVREVTGVFPSRDAATTAVDALLLAGFDRANIDTLAEGEPLRRRVGDTPVPAVVIAEMPDAPRRGFIAPEDTAIVVSLCVAVVGGLGAMVGAIFVVAQGASAFWTVVAALVGGAVGAGIGMLIANALGWRWRQSPVTPAGTDGTVLFVRMQSPDREEEALRILNDLAAEAVQVHETEIKKTLEDLPLLWPRPDELLSAQRDRN